MPASSIRVRDPFVRLFHWSPVTCLLIALISGEEESPVHVYSGYAVMTLLLTRLLWDFIGTEYARLSRFACPPGGLIKYLKDLATGRP